MPPFALTLLILLSPGDEPMATSIAAASRATLGAQSVLELRFVATPPDDGAAVELASVNRAAAIALVTWSDAAHRHARLRVYAQSKAHWAVRELEFTEQDLPEEKGRTIGFNIASMLPDNDAALAGNEPAPPTAATPSAETGAQAKPPLAVQSATPTAETHAPPALVEPDVAPATTAAPWTFALDAAAQGVLAIRGEGTSAGGALGSQYRLGAHFTLCAGAALRIGHIQALEARMVAVDFGPGLAWRSGDVDASRRWGLHARLDAFARLQSVRRDSERSQPNESHARVVPGVGVGLELTFALNQGVALLANTTIRAVLGQTDLILRGSRVATFAPLELGLGLGARAYF